jgi:predicted phosphodiesterase
VLGIDTYPIREVTEHASGRYNDGPLYEIAFGVRSLPGEFFLIPTHRARIENAHGKTKQTVSWVVDSVESTGRMEETFCCEVPTTQSFLLADGILTSNCIEGVVAQNGRLVARLDLSVTEQVRLYRRLALHQIATLSPLANEVLVVCVAGNHDESYRQVDMGVNDSWAIEGMSAVSDALVLGGDKYSHVKFLFPEHERLDVTFNAGSLESPFVIGLTHGHLASSPNGEINWWKGQAHAEQPIGQAQLLLTGHFHHLRIEQTGCRKSWIQLPAMDGGSAWFLRKKGEDSAAGMITLDIGDGRWSNLRVWE